MNINIQIRSFCIVVASHFLPITVPTSAIPFPDLYWDASIDTCIPPPYHCHVSFSPSPQWPDVVPQALHLPSLLLLSVWQMSPSLCRPDTRAAVPCVARHTRCPDPHIAACSTHHQTSRPGHTGATIPHLTLTACESGRGLDIYGGDYYVLDTLVTDTPSWQPSCPCTRWCRTRGSAVSMTTDHRGRPSLGEGKGRMGANLG